VIVHTKCGCEGKERLGGKTAARPTGGDASRGLRLAHILSSSFKFKLFHKVTVVTLPSSEAPPSYKS